MALLEPTLLVSEPRNSGGSILALAKTDTGVASVIWDPLAKIWKPSENSVGDVLAAAPAPASLLMDEEVDTSNTDLSLFKAKEKNKIKKNFIHTLKHFFRKFYY